jgi:hypothetical protein
MKKIVILFVMLVCALQSNAQTLLRSSTTLEGTSFSTTPDFTETSYLSRTNVDQTIYWRKRYNRDSQEKSVYNFHSIYKRDSILGIRLYGIDIDMMSEKFEKRKANTFRYWNKIRLGFSLMIEGNPKHEMYPIEEFYYYIDAEIYFSYLHLPKSARGDRETKARRGAYMLFIMANSSQRMDSYYLKMDAYFKVKPFQNVWLNLYYHQEYLVQRVSILAEVELNKRGYDKTKVESSKDLYRGITIFGGPEMNVDTKQISLRLGMKCDLRNH